MKTILLLAIAALTGCASVSGPYVPPSSGKTASLTIDNRKISSVSRTIRIVGPTTSGCIGEPFVTTEQFEIAPNIYRITIPAGEKIVLRYREGIDLSRGSMYWYGDYAFTPEAGTEYSFHSYFKLREYEYVKTNEDAPPVLKKAVADWIKRDPEGMGEGAMTAVIATDPVSKKSVWVQRENPKLPKEKSEGYCPQKK